MRFKNFLNPLHPLKQIVSASTKVNPKQDELAVPTLYSHETRLASISYSRCTVFLSLEHILEPKRTVKEINHFPNSN